MPKRRHSDALDSSGSSPPRVRTIYIHGIGQHPPANVWKSQWDLALFGRPMKDATVGAYWADVLHGDQYSQEIPPEGPIAEWASLLEEAHVDEFDSRAAVFANRFAAQVTQTSHASTGGTSQAETLALPESWGTDIARAFLKVLVRDTASYFFNEEIRRKVRQRLIEQIPDDGSRLVLVTHSQGTIIAYEVLSMLSEEQRERVQLFVTLGSPLGIQEIQDLLARDDMPTEFPIGIGAWHNFADRFDPVSLDWRLANDFVSGDSSWGRSKDVVQDHPIVNTNLWKHGRLNPHDSAGYLSHPEVRAEVYQALNFDLARRFVVARDVAQGFAARHVRQPVLIEALEPGYGAAGESEKDRSKREKKQLKNNEKMGTLAGRIEFLADEIRTVVGNDSDDESAIEDANIQRLRKFVAARLTPTELHELARRHDVLNIYAVWRSSRKSKLIHRSHAAIGADAARSSFKATGNRITWAVLDTGCRFDHPHFKRNRKKDVSIKNSLVLDVLDCTTSSDLPQSIMDEYDAYLSDPDGHGTHVCGIVSGKGKESGLTYEGVAPKANLLVYKVLDEYGEGEDAWIIKAIDDIFRRNENCSGLVIHGVNLSLGGPFDASVYGCGFSPICQSLRELWRQGVLVCVAAGNEGQIQVTTLDGSFDLNTTLSIGDPANLEDCIAAGSANTDKPYLYGISHFSSRGPTADGRVKPDIVAPGERISSCSHDFVEKLYRTSSGTSMACPHVSGLLAAFLSVRREFIGRPDEVKRILLDNCNDLGRDRRHQGHGIPNLLKMLTET